MWRKKETIVISVIVGLILITGISLTIVYFSSRSTSNVKIITTEIERVCLGNVIGKTILINNMKIT